MSVIFCYADSCVKPFEKNEQLHNAGVKKKKKKEACVAMQEGMQYHGFTL